MTFDVARARGQLQDLLLAEGGVGAVGVVVTPAGAAVMPVGSTLASTGEPVTAHTRFLLASVTKTLTAAVVLQSVIEGRLRLDDPLDVPGVGFAGPGSRHGGPTLGQVLSHTGSIGDLRTPSTAARMLVRRRPQHVPVPGTPQADFADGPVFLDVPPGRKFSYSNQGYSLLGRIAGDLTGHGYATSADALLFGPAGMSDAVVGPRPAEEVAAPHVLREGNPVLVRPRSAPAWFGGRGAGGAWASGADMAAFLSGLLGLGTGLAVGLGPMMWTTRWQQHPAMPGWGLGLATDVWDGVQVAYHNGYVPGAKAVLLLLPEHQVGVAIMLNCGTGLEAMDSRKARLAWDWARQAAGLSLEPPPSAASQAGSGPGSGKRAGRYVWPRGWNTNLRHLSYFGPYLRVRDTRSSLRLSNPRGRLDAGVDLTPTRDPEVFTLAGTHLPSHLVLDGRHLFFEQTQLTRLPV